MMRSLRAVPAGHARNASRTSLATLGGAVGSTTNGGGLLRGRVTSDRVASVTPIVMPAAATAAAPTIIHTRSRWLTAATVAEPRRYICESDAGVQGIAATGTGRDRRGRRREGAGSDRHGRSGHRRRARAVRVGRGARSGGAAHPARLPGVAHRARRAGPVPARGRRVEPAAPDRPLDRAPRRGEGGVGEAHDRGAES